MASDSADCSGVSCTAMISRRNTALSLILLVSLCACERSDTDPQALILVEQAWQTLQDQDYHEALALADSAAVLDDRLAEAQFVRGRILFDLNQFNASESAYKVVLQLNPSYPGAHHNLGNALFGQGQYREAILHFRREAAPNSWHAAGAAHVRLGQPDSALAAFLQVTAMDSTYRPVHKSLAELYEQLGQYERALEHAGIAGDRYLTGLMLFHLNRHDDAAKELENVIATDSSHHSAFYALGQVQLRRGEVNEAEELLGQAASLREQEQRIAAAATAARENPSSFSHQMAHAAMLLETGRLTDTIDAWLIALALQPASLDLQSNIGTAYMQLGDTTRAVDRYLRVLSVDSTHATTLVNMGWHYFRTDRRQEAVQVWARAARLHPTHPAIKTLKETLQQQPSGSVQNSPVP